MEILIATHNQHKKEEIIQILPSHFVVQSLSDFHLNDEIVEDGSSFEENAFIKANYGFQNTHRWCIGDDSGLVIPALDGRPGIYSARYAGNHDFKANIAKILQEMQGIENRNAYFITLLCLKSEHETHYFEGRVYGTIANEILGSNGFGYDPIFIPTGYRKSFAEFCPDEKNAISHRFHAFQKLLNYLKTQSR